MPSKQEPEPGRPGHCCDGYFNSCVSSPWHIFFLFLHDLFFSTCRCFLFQEFSLAGYWHFMSFKKYIFHFPLFMTFLSNPLAQFSRAIKNLSDFSQTSWLLICECGGHTYIPKV